MLQEKADSAGEQLAATVREYTDRLALKDKSLETAEQKCQDWESQSELLHKQLEKVGRLACAYMSLHVFDIVILILKVAVINF